MKNTTFKKIALLHVCTLAATTSFAELPKAAIDKTHWYYAVTGLYQKPSDSNHWSYVAGPGEGESKDLATTRVNSDYVPALALSLGYFYTPTDDVSMHFIHAKFNDGFSSSNSTAPTEENTPFFDSTKVRFKENYDSLSITTGRVFASDNWNVHLFGGVDYTYIKENFNLYDSRPAFEYSDDLYNSPKISSSSTYFHGLGPQIGFDSSYKLQDSFNLVGGANVSLLASKLAYYSNGSGDFPRGPLAYKTNRAALKAQANLGVSYEKVIQNNYLLTIELGYKTLFLQSQTGAPDGGESSRGNGGHYNFSMSGPYLGVKVSL